MAVKKTERQAEKTAEQWLQSLLKRHERGERDATTCDEELPLPDTSLARDASMNVLPLILLVETLQARAVVGATLDAPLPSGDGRGKEWSAYRYEQQHERVVFNGGRNARESNPARQPDTDSGLPADGKHNARGDSSSRSGR
jgi:hypothetical protein